MLSYRVKSILQQNKVDKSMGNQAERGFSDAWVVSNT